VIGTSLVLRLAWAASLGGYTNEAYYYMYARNPAWGYFDHPPMVGAIAAVGLKLFGDYAPVFGLRLGFAVLFAGSSWLLARLTARWFGGRAGVLAVLALNATVFYGLIVGTFATPDGPLLFFWLLALNCLWVALEQPNRISAWFGVGLAWGGALLSKYHAVLLPLGAVLYLLLQPAARRCLRQPGPYLACALGLGLFGPVIVWNAHHDWVSFLYQGTRAGGFRGVHLAMLLEALVGQFLYVTPWIWAMLVTILVRQLGRGPRHWTGPEAFLICQALPALLLFLGVAVFQRIMPHWPLIGFVALMPLLGRFWAERLSISPAGARRRLVAMTAAPVVLAFLFIVQAHTGLFQDQNGRLLGVFRATADPTVDTIRWEQIALELKRRGLLEDPATFLFTEHWRFSAELAMAMRCAAPVACFHRDARSFAFWSRPEEWLGRSGIFVRVEESEVDARKYARWFSHIEPIASFPITRAGVAIETVRLYRCVRQTTPFMFGCDYPTLKRDSGQDGNAPQTRRVVGQLPGLRATH
jgi:4-amino-4-deoxy-L-arabinose transferase-like glycosyltransferase